MAHWWQSESREKRTLRKVTELAVELGRLPTFEEVKNLEEGLVSDAAFYYGSYNKLRELVASRLYGHNSRTFPADTAKLQKGFGAAEYTEAARRRRLDDYKKRLIELGMWPKDEARLETPAPLPEGSVKHESIAKNISEEVIKVAGKPRVSKEDCVKAIREAYDEFGRLHAAEYVEHAGAHGWPAMMTMRKNVGPVRDWYKYLEGKDELQEPEKDEPRESEKVKVEEVAIAEPEQLSFEPQEAKPKPPALTLDGALKVVITGAVLKLTINEQPMEITIQFGGN